VGNPILMVDRVDSIGSDLFMTCEINYYRGEVTCASGKRVAIPVSSSHNLFYVEGCEMDWMITRTGLLRLNKGSKVTFTYI
jgi:hypothetical protein